MESKLINFPKIADPRGNLTFFENPFQISFEIKRVFWTYDVPGGEERGGHAYKKQEEVIIALSGSFDVIITSKSGEIIKYSLNIMPRYQLLYQYIVSMTKHFQYTKYLLL